MSLNEIFQPIYYIYIISKFEWFSYITIISIKSSVIIVILHSTAYWLKKSCFHYCEECSEPLTRDFITSAWVQYSSTPFSDSVLHALSLYIFLAYLVSFSKSFSCALFFFLFANWFVCIHFTHVEHKDVHNHYDDLQPFLCFKTRPPYPETRQN